MGEAFQSATGIFAVSGLRRSEKEILFEATFASRRQKLVQKTPGKFHACWLS
jgi:hypothetical protein